MKRKITVYRKVAKKKIGKHKNHSRPRSRLRIVGKLRKKTRKKRNLQRKVERLAPVDYSLIFKRNSQELSVIITMLSNEELNKELLQNIQGIQPREVIVVQIGPTDRNTVEGIEQEIRFFTYPHSHNIFLGRGIGANFATGEILLFLDNRNSISSNDLLPFVIACYRKTDIALPNNNPFYAKREKFDPVNVAKSFLNQTLRLPHLKFSSLIDTPHAIKKKTVDIIGVENLCIPPKAMVIAVLNSQTVDQITSTIHLSKSKVTPIAYKIVLAKETLLGDHMEAFHYLQSTLGKRAYYTDKMRRREKLNDINK